MGQSICTGEIHRKGASEWGPTSMLIGKGDADSSENGLIGDEGELACIAERM